MRNEAKPLNPVETAVQSLRHAALPVGRRVHVEYVKRNGEKSSATGEVKFFNGRPGYDTGSVTIDTEDCGPRTVNLHRITKVVKL